MKLWQVNALRAEALAFSIATWAAVFLCAAALSGCMGSNTPPPAVEVRTVVEKVIVPVPCVTASDIAPEPPHVANQLTGQAGHDLLIVDQSALDLRTWGEANAAQLKACAGPARAPAGPPPAPGPQNLLPAQ
jgi:hypothetical protein